MADSSQTLVSGKRQLFGASSVNNVSTLLHIPLLFIHSAAIFTFRCERRPVTDTGSSPVTCCRQPLVSLQVRGRCSIYTVARPPATRAGPRLCGGQVRWLLGLLGHTALT